MPSISFYWWDVLQFATLCLILLSDLLFFLREQCGIDCIVAVHGNGIFPFSNCFAELAFLSNVDAYPTSA